MKQYFYLDGENKKGPFTKEELKSENISRDSKVWFYGMDSWAELSQIPELTDLLLSIPPPIKENVNKLNRDSNLRSVIKQKNQIKVPVNRNNKTIIILSLLTIISIFTYLAFQVNQEKKLYNEIASNAIDPSDEFNIYVEKFYRDLDIYGIYPQKPKETIIKFSQLDKIKNGTHIHGISYGYNNDNLIEIYINQSSWSKFNKPMKYLLMYHELSHDILNLKDLEAIPKNEGLMMYPEISTYENLTMDDFIESMHNLFETL